MFAHKAHALALHKCVKAIGWHTPPKLGAQTCPYGQPNVVTMPKEARARTAMKTQYHARE